MRVWPVLVVLCIACGAPPSEDGAADGGGPNTGGASGGASGGGTGGGVGSGAGGSTAGGGGTGGGAGAGAGGAVAGGGSGGATGGGSGTGGASGGGTGGGAGAGGASGGGAGGGPTGGGAGTTGPLLYPVGRRHSPVTAAVVAQLQAIAARGPALKNDVFAKVGDSNTVNTNYLAPFAGANVDLSTHAALQPTLTHFLGGTAGTTTSFNRASLCATVGWSAWAATTGTPSPLDREVTAISPRFATVMYGTNDIQAGDVFAFGRNMAGIADRLLAQGVIPVFTAIPPRDDSAAADLQVPRYNLVTRAVAQARRVPYVELEQELRLLPGHGLGPDGLHLEVYTVGGASRGAVLTAAGLAHGHNLRNLMTLQALDRALDAVQGKPAPDATAPTLAGLGTAATPFEVPSLPFVDLHDTRTQGTTALNTYPGCAAAQDESGKELLYRFTLPQAATVRAFVVALGGADIDLHLLSGPSGAACLERNDKLIVRSLPAGTYWLSLDTFVAGGVAKAGEFLLVLTTD